MKKISKNNQRKYWNWYVIFFGVLITSLMGCKKFVEVPAPVSSIGSGNVYTTDATAIAVLTGAYQSMINNWGGRGDIPSLSYYGSLSADELTYLYTSPNSYESASYTNQLNSQSTYNFNYWSLFYNYIFIANSAMEGLQQSSSLTPAVKQQLLGEAEFLRAFCFFYLVNLYGDVPLTLTTDYKVNAQIARTSTDLVYKQIIGDLLDAQNKLSYNFLDATLLKSTTERIRPTNWAATALLARAYLYSGAYQNAIQAATTVISNSAQFNLVPLNQAFLSNNTEAIWQLQASSQNPKDVPDAYLFIVPSTGPSSSNPVSLSTFLLNAFEPGDQRKTNWTSGIVIAGSTVNYAYKYKNNISGSTITEYNTVFRLAEQYLIRAEAEANLNNPGNAAADLNIVRTRAGLSNISAATQAALLTAILHERQVEFFTEWGHRWLDLKRNGTIDSVMSVVTPQKGGNAWNPIQSLYPIPLTDITANVNLEQNPGF